MEIKAVHEASVFRMQTIAGSLSARDFKGFDRGDMHQLSKLVPIPEKDVVGCLSDGAHMGGGLNGQDAYTGRILACSSVLYENHPNDSRVTGPHEVAPSCVSRFGTGGGNVPLVQEAIAFEPGIATREGSESRFVKELSPTLRKDMGDNQVAVAVDAYNQTAGSIAPTIGAKASDINHTGGVINPKDRMAVRRLTPKECERLQGFPDDHTLIPWRNKPTDQCPDGPRYKALGNSMAVPCMRWIGERIDKCQNAK